jgi:gliding motility-associated-like protein
MKVTSSIIIYGISNSLNYPCTVNAFDTTYNSGAGFNYDIIITKLDLSGSSLNASTYVGGVGNEYFNYFQNTVWGWGGLEMEVDRQGNIYGIGCSNSGNFPTTSGAISSALNGASDAIAFKIDSGLSNLIWATYLGGSGNENGTSIKLDGSGGAYLFGSTSSTNFPVTSGVYNPIKNGIGVTADLYVSHINSSGGLTASTFLGTASQDYAYLMDIDLNGDIYLFGNVSNSSQLVPTPGTYSNPNGANFIYKMNSTLSNVLFKTKFGNVVSQTIPYLVFNAVKVDSCGKIYISGFGPKTFPTTPNAFQAYGGGPTDIYMAVFNQNCASLAFASFFGGSQSNNWSTIPQNSPGEATCTADFDNKGCLYTGVSIPGGLPTTPNAYAPTIVSTSTWITCNDAFLKVDFQTFVNASSYGANITGCPPFTPTFVSSTNTGSTYWDLGNGVTSTMDTISTTYTTLGNYNVLLVVTDTNTCNKTDSIKSILSVINPTTFDLGEDIQTCFNSKALIQPNVTAVTYSWSTGQTSPNIMALPGSYTLTINNGGCNSSDSIHVIVSEKKLSERFPNVVTPNADGINDLIELKKYNFAEVELTIYDRWGREVVKFNDPNAEWKPDDLNAGTYFYVAHYLSNCIGEYATDKGFITLFK